VVVCARMRILSLKNAINAQESGLRGNSECQLDFYLELERLS
jgi:hypothetical protein